MYEQTEVSVWRRVLWIALWAIVLIAVIWTLVWLIFLRNDAGKTIAPQTKQLPHSKSDSGRTQSSTSTGSSSQNQSTQTPQPDAGQQSSGTAPATSTTLANTGPGNVIVPVLAAVFIGSTFYYIRTTRKSVQ